MQNKQTKLLVESWRAFLNEEEPVKPQATGQAGGAAFQTLDQLVDKAYPEFVQGLQKLIQNEEFKKLLTNANPEDPNNKLNVTTANFKCKDLLPMQNVIGLDDSLQFDLKSPKKIKEKASGGTLPPEVYDFKARPIITCGKFIIDGHHRWSTCYMLNPENTLVVQNITNFKDGTSALKASQLIIGAIKGQIPISEPKGINVFASDPISIKGWIEKTMSDAFVKEYAPYADKIMRASVGGVKQAETSQQKVNEAEQTEPSTTQAQKDRNKRMKDVAIAKKPGKETPSAGTSDAKTKCVNALKANIVLLRKNNLPKGDAAKNPRTIMPQFADEGPAIELQKAISGQGVNVAAIKKAIAEEVFSKRLKQIIKEEINKIKR